MDEPELTLQDILDADPEYKRKQLAAWEAEKRGDCSLTRELLAEIDAEEKGQSE